MDETAIQELADSVGATRHKKSGLPALGPPSWKSVVDNDAKAEAKQFLAVRRQSSSAYRDPTTKFARHFMPKKQVAKQLDTSLWKYSQEERDVALQYAIEHNAPSDVIAALLELGAVVDFDRALPPVTAAWNADLLNLLLNHREKKDIQKVLDRCLEDRLKELSKNEANEPSYDQVLIISNLVVTGARVREASLEKAVSQQQRTLVEVLLQKRNHLRPQALASCLNRAVLVNDYDLVSMLLTYGADPNANDATCVVEAITSKRYKLAVAMVAFAQEHKISTPNLAICLDTVLRSVPITDDYKWLQLFLYAGADPSVSSKAAKRLCEAVANGEFPTVELLVNYATPIASLEHNALEGAIRKSDKRMVGALLQKKRKPEAIGGLVPLLRRRFSPEDEIEITQWFVVKGAAGSSGMDIALATLVEDIVSTNGSRPPSELQERHIQMLLDGQASVDWDRGAALRHAFAAQNLKVTQLLCRRGISQQTLAITLDNLHKTGQQGSTGPSLPVVECILQRKPDRKAVNEALLKTVQQDPENCELVKLLLGYGANVCHRDNVILYEAISKCNLRTFEAIASDIESENTIKEVFEEALSNLPKAKILLQACYSQSALNDALAAEVCRSNIRYDVLDFILNKGASAEHKEGSILQQVCQREDLQALGMMSHRASASTRGKALQRTIESCSGTRVIIACELLGETCIQSAIDDSLVVAVKKKQHPSKGSAPIRRDSKVAESPRTESRKNSFQATEDDRESLVDLLLGHGADVNFGDGAAMKAAIDQSTWSVLKMLVKSTPSTTTLDNVFSYARSVLESDDTRYRAYDILLSARTFKPTALDDALVDLATHGSEHEELCVLLLSIGASVNHLEGEAIMHTIGRRNPRILTLMLDYGPSPEVVTKALQQTMYHPPNIRLEFAKLLLEAGASGDQSGDFVNQAVREDDSELVQLLMNYNNCLSPQAAEAVVLTATCANVDQLQLLLSHVNDTSISTKALDAMTEQQTVRKQSKAKECACMLLDHGVEQQAIDRTLATYIEEAGTNDYDEEYVTALLDHSANVNALNAQCLRCAAQNGQHKLFLQLISYGAGSQVLTWVLPLLFTSGIPEESLVAIIHYCFALQEKPDTGVSSYPEPLTYLSLVYYPEGEILLQTLLEYGYNAQWLRGVSVTAEKGEERGNALVWLLFNDKESRASDTVVQNLIEAKVDPNFTTRTSKISPLMIAASNNRYSIVELLLEHGADVNLRDYLGRTALCYASENGHLDVVTKLCANGAKGNDGSLHDAARELHASIVQHLLHSGRHKPDYPSPRHEGRSALLETLLKCQMLTDDKRMRLDQTIEALMHFGSDLTIKDKDKNALYCSLANEHPFEVLDSFLSTDAWETLDKRHNWITDTNGKCYSATMYLEHGPWQGQTSERSRLQSLLKLKRCPDRYFAWEGDQPPGAVGFPEEIAQKEQSKKAILEEHHLRLRLAGQSHTQQIEWDRARHAESIRQDRERQHQQLQAEENRHQQTLQHNAQIGAQRQNAMKQEKTIEFEHSQKMMKEQEDAAVRQHGRQQQQIQWANESENLRSRNRATEMQTQRNLIEAGRHLGPGGQHTPPRLLLKDAPD